MSGWAYAPVQNDRDHPYGEVPWAVHERAFAEYAKHFHHQTAYRIAERGGFSYGELACLLDGHNPWDGEWPEDHQHPPVAEWKPLAERLGLR